MAALRPSLPTTEMRANFRRLYADLAWYGVLTGSTLAFLSIYAARIGASSFQMGLLSAGPAVVNFLFSLPVGHWLKNQPLIRVCFLSSIWNRLGYIALIPLPWIFSNPGWIVWAIVLITLAMSIPGTVVNIAFFSVFAELVPKNYRADVIGRRNALLAIFTTVAVLVSGQILDYIPFELNYQIVFLIGAAGAMVSSYYLSQLRSPEEPGQRFYFQIVRGTCERLLSALKRAWINVKNFQLNMYFGQNLRLDLLRGPFGSFMLAYLLFYTFQYLPVPLFPLYLVNQLKLTDGVISLGNALFYVLMMLVSLRLGKISSRWGNRSVLVFGALFFGGYPLLIFLARDPTLYWAASFYGGLVWGISGGALLNRLMERVPENDRPAHMAIHNLVLNTGILAGSLIGPVLSDWLGLRPVIGISAILRLLGGILIWIWG